MNEIQEVDTQYTVPWRWFDVVKTLGWAFLSVVLFIIIYAIFFAINQSNPNSEYVDSGLPMWIFSSFTLVFYTVVLLAVYWYSIKRYDAPLRSLGLNGFRLFWVWALPAIFFIQIIAAALVNPAFWTSLTQTVSETGTDYIAASGYSSEPEVTNVQVDLITSVFVMTASDRILLLIAIGLAAPITEEVFFRGMLHPLLKKRFSVWTSILIGSTIFALVHCLPTLIPTFFVIGFILTYVREMSGSVLPSIVLHICQNSLFVYYLNETQTI